MRENILAILLIALLCVIVLGGLVLCVLSIVLSKKYANVPVSELPTWVWWLLQGAGK